MKHGKLKIGDRVDMLLIVGCRKEGEGSKSVLYWAVKCDCGHEREMRTNHIRMKRATLKVSCGCLKKISLLKQIAKARARIGMQERDEKEPTPLEIAEECSRIHNDAGREPPAMLIRMLDELRAKEPVS